MNSIDNNNLDNNKMKFDYILNKPKTPLVIFNGIFSTFGTNANKEFYYNYLDYKVEKNIKNDKNYTNTNKIHCNSSNGSSKNSLVNLCNYASNLNDDALNNNQQVSTNCNIIDQENIMMIID